MGRCVWTMVVCVGVCFGCDPGSEDGGDRDAGAATSDGASPGDAAADVGGGSDARASADVGGGSDARVPADGGPPASAPPTLSIVQPVPGAVVEALQRVEIEASDDVGVTEVLIAIDGAEQVALRSAPYVWVWDTSAVPHGLHRVGAVAVDADGQRAEAEVEVRVPHPCGDDEDCPPGLPVLEAPSLEAPVCGAVALRASADDDVGLAAIRFFVDDALVGEAVAAPFEVEWDASQATDGAHDLRLVAVDTVGQEAEWVGEVTVQNAGGPCDAPPTVRFVAPVEDGPVTGLVEVAAEAEDDDGVVSVRFFLDNALVQDRPLAPYRFELDTGDFAEGEHTLSARATDTSGKTGEAELSLVIDRTPPQVVITAPEADVVVLEGSVAASAEVSDDRALDRVEFSVDDGPAVVVLQAPPWEADLPIDGLEGRAHSVRVQAFDRAGNVAEARQPFLIDAPPVVAFEGLADGDVVEGPITLQVRASDDDQPPEVRLWVDGELAGPFDAAGRFAWAPAYVAGPVTLRAVAWDSADQRGEDQVTVVVDHPTELTLLFCDAECVEPAGPVRARGEARFEAQVRDDAPVGRVSFSVGGQLREDVAGPPFAYTVAVDALPDGAHFVRAAVHDGDQTLTEAQVVLQVDSCDLDGDGVRAEGARCGGRDCDDDDPEVNPGQPDPVADGRDWDCDGFDGPAPIPGGACARDADCLDGAFCVTEADTDGGYPGGFCRLDCVTDDDCGDGAGCFSAGGADVCFRTCDRTADCRPDWACFPVLGTGQGACIGHCASTGCDGGDVCDADTGLCGPAPCPVPCQAGEECVDQRCLRFDGSCDTDYQCPEGDECSFGACDVPPGGACLDDFDCPFTQNCFNGACVAGCNMDTDCPLDRFCADTGTAGVCLFLRCGESEQNGRVYGECFAGGAGQWPGTCRPWILGDPAAPNDFGLCVEAGTARVGEPCDDQALGRTPQDRALQCARGLLCTGDPDVGSIPSPDGLGRCYQLCNPDAPSCDEPGLSCLNRGTPDDPATPDVDERVIEGLCLEPECLVLADDCPAGQHCAAHSFEQSDGVCVPSGPTPHGGECTVNTDCAAGTACFDFDGRSQCLEACDPHDVASCSDALTCNAMVGWPIGLCYAPLGLDASCAGQDIAEPDDSPDEALELFALPVNAPGLRLCAGDEDWAWVQVCGGGTLTVEIRFDHDLGNLDLALYSADGRRLAASTSDDDDERIVLPVAEDARIDIRRFGRAFAGNGEYTLIVEIAGCPAP